MAPDFRVFDVLNRHGVPFLVIGGHAVSFHGYVRATEDTDVLWMRSPESERALLAALEELKAEYIGNEIDPATGIERTYPVTASFVRSQSPAGRGIFSTSRICLRPDADRGWSADWSYQSPFTAPSWPPRPSPWARPAPRR